MDILPIPLTKYSQTPWRLYKTPLSRLNSAEKNENWLETLAPKVVSSLGFPFAAYSHWVLEKPTMWKCQWAQVKNDDNKSPFSLTKGPRAPTKKKPTAIFILNDEWMISPQVRNKARMPVLTTAIQCGTPTQGNKARTGKKEIKLPACR